MHAAAEMSSRKTPAPIPAIGIEMRPERAIDQLAYLWREASMAGGDRGSWKNLCWAVFRANTCVIASYRLRRFFLLSFGRFFGVACLLAMPILAWCRVMGGRHEFPPRAQIGPGLRIAHPCRSCVLSEWLVAGKNLYLTGGNVIGVRRRIQRGQLTIGDDCMLGIDAKVIGPLKLGNSVRVGAGAVVVHDFEGPVTLVGVPAEKASDGPRFACSA
jgi:serine acetyltransferase